MAQFYYATSQKPTAVTHAAVGAFTGANDLNLILGRSTRVEVLTLTDEGLQPVIDMPLYGRIATLRLIRLHGQDLELLMITTERQQFMVLGWDARGKKFTNVAKGDLRDRIGRKTDRAPIALFEPSGRAAVFQFYEGLLKVVPCDPTFREQAYNVRIEEPAGVVDMAFLHGARVPTLAVLYKDMADECHLRTYVLSLVDRRVEDGPWPNVAVPGRPTMLIPVPAPLGGVLLVGETQVSWHGGSGKRPEDVVSTSLVAGTSMLPRCYGMIDESRYLIGDAGGSVYLLALATEEADGGMADVVGSGAGGAGAGVGGRAPITVSSIQLDLLGSCTLPSTISYLDDGHVFVGSVLGDSLLIQIQTDKDPDTGKFFKEKARFSNMGPIVDVCVQDLDRAGQGQLVCASGAYQEGSLRVVHSGIGIEEIAAVPDLPGIRGVWALRAASAAPHHRYLVQSYSGSTRVMVAAGESLEEGDEMSLPGFIFNAPSLFCGNMAGDLMLQVTATEARLLRAADGSTVSSWSPPAGVRVTVATGNTRQVLLAFSNKEVRYFELSGTALVQKAARGMPHDVACMNVNPLGAAPAAGSSTAEAAGAGAAGMEVDVGGAASSGTAALASIGLWTEVSIHLVNLTATPGIELLADVAVEAVGGAIPPRSTLLTTLKGGQHYAFLGIGDGQLYSFRLEADAASAGLPRLVDKKGVQLGRQPIALSSFSTGTGSNGAAVFAACDRPTVVHAVPASKLAYSNVNCGDLTAMCAFSTEALPDCIALAGEAGLTIGAVDEIQKLHVRTIPLGEQPRRVVHYKAAGVIAVAVEGARPGLEGTGDLVEAGSLRIFDDTTFEPLNGGRPFDLDPSELAMSMTVAICHEDTRAPDGIL